MERWNRSVALVTGASSGIGAGICRELVKHGMIVVGCARRIEKIEAIANEEIVKISPGELIPIQCDVTDESQILAVFNEIRKRFGRLDVCVNNAGLNHMAPLLSGNTSDWKNMFEVNVLSLCICSREAVKLMKEKGIDDGQIIHIGSMSGHRFPNLGMGGTNFYTGTKFMVRALTEGLRRELKASNSHIRIGSISPGMVETEFFDTFLKNDSTGMRPEDLFTSIECLTAKDIADAVIYILGTPPHVEIHDILVRPREQAV